VLLGLVTSTGAGLQVISVVLNVVVVVEEVVVVVVVVVPRVVVSLGDRLKTPSPKLVL
jgi:hypothetical protein